MEQLGFGGLGGAGVSKQGLMTFLAEGIRSKVPGCQVNVLPDGLEIIFTKELVMQKLFEGAGELSKVANVDIDGRGIIIRVKI